MCKGRGGEGGRRNWGILLNHYRVTFTLVESQVVLVKSYPSHTHASTPLIPPHPCLLPFPTKKASLSSLPRPSAFRSPYWSLRWSDCAPASGWRIIMRLSGPCVGCCTSPRCKSEQVQARRVHVGIQRKTPKHCDKPISWYMWANPSHRHALYLQPWRASPLPLQYLWENGANYSGHVFLLRAGCPGERWSESGSGGGDSAAQWHLQ